MATRDRKPLLAYLDVQENYEAELITILKRAASDNEKMIKALAGKQGIGARIRVEQLQATKKAILDRQAELWRAIGQTVQAGRAEAASAAVRTTFLYQDVVLRSGIGQPDRDRLVASLEAQAQRGIDGLIRRVLGLENYTLSKQVYKTRALSNGLLTRLIQNKITNGVSWRELAAAVVDYIRPDTPGGVAYAAKRLARTELNNTFHATSVDQGVKSPFVVGQQWNLSGSHPVPDECNEYAEEVHFIGGMPGVYRPADVPSKPHPQCLCFITPEVDSREDFIKNFIGGKYDNFLAENGVETPPTRPTPNAPAPAPATPPKDKNPVVPKRPKSTPTVEKIQEKKPAPDFGGSPEDKIRNAEIMYGTNSKQHLAAIKKFGPKPAPSKVKRVDPKKWQTATDKKTVDRILAQDGDAFGMDRATLERLIKGDPPLAVLQRGRITTQIREEGVSEERAELATNTIFDLMEKDAVDRDISIMIRKLDKTENPNGGTMAFTSIGGDAIVVNVDALTARTTTGLMPSGVGMDPLVYFMTHEWGHVRANEKHDTDIDPKELSRYAKYSGDEAYAEAYAEWIITKGKTTIKTVQELAVRFQWPAQ